MTTNLQKLESVFLMTGFQGVVAAGTSYWNAPDSYLAGTLLGTAIGGITSVVQEVYVYDHSNHHELAKGMFLSLTTLALVFIAANTSYAKTLLGRVAPHLPEEMVLKLCVANYITHAVVTGVASVRLC